MQFQKGYITNGIYFRKILAIVDEVAFVSEWWDKDSYTEAESILRQEQRGATIKTFDELEAKGWIPCTAIEAGAPAEKWRPETGFKYFYGIFDGRENRCLSSAWYDAIHDHDRLAIGNVHKTEEEAIKYMEDRMNV